MSGPNPNAVTLPAAERVAEFIKQHQDRCNAATKRGQIEVHLGLADYELLIRISKAAADAWLAQKSLESSR
jgi:hypothetical protein